VHRLREDWLQCVGLWVRRQAGYDVQYLNEGGQIMLLQMLFRDEFITMVERLDVHLFIWKQVGWSYHYFPRAHSQL